MAVMIVAMGGTAPPAGGQSVTELPGSDRPLELSLTEEYRVGAVDGAPWEMFTSIASVAFDERGRLHIFDRGNRSLVRVGPDGRFQRELIRRGEGPGEISMPSVAGVERDGSVAVMDMARRSLYWFSPEGELMGSVVVDAMQGDPMPAAPLHSHPEGGLLSAGTSLAVSGSRTPLGETSFSSVPVHRFQLGEPTRTIFEAWRPSISEDDLPTPPSGLGGMGGGSGMMVTPPGGVRAFAGGDPGPALPAPGCDRPGQGGGAGPPAGSPGKGAGTPDPGGRGCAHDRAG